jgi:hypothetical protein
MCLFACRAKLGLIGHSARPAGLREANRPGISPKLAQFYSPKLVELISLNKF